MEAAKKNIAIGFGISVLIFGIIAILGIWDIVDRDVTENALSTLGVILIVTFIGSVVLNNLSKKK